MFTLEEQMWKMLEISWRDSIADDRCLVLVLWLPQNLEIPGRTLFVITHKSWHIITHALGNKFSPAKTKCQQLERIPPTSSLFT
jgi:hypothetical protein